MKAHVPEPAKMTLASTNNVPSECYTGGSQAHNNMPPYLAVYMWRRTA